MEESRRKEHQGGRGSSSLDPPFLVWGTLRGSSLFLCLACGPVSYARNGPPPSWAGWERQEFWDPLRWAPKIGGCTPNRASKAGTLGVSRVFCPAHGPGHPLLAFGQFTLCPCKKQIGFCSGPCEGRKSATLGSSLPKAFPSGGRCPSAHTGADEGAIWYPTFPCRKGTLYRPSPQRSFSIAPLGNPVAPSSVTSGDSFPPRGSLWAVQPYPKKRSKSGHADGLRNSPTTGTMRHNRQNERVPTSGP